MREHGPRAIEPFLRVKFQPFRDKPHQRRQAAWERP
jgi:hypothetical protein